METQTQGWIQGARKRQRVQRLGLKRNGGCQLSELMDSPLGALSTTDPKEMCLAVDPRDHLIGRKADAQRGWVIAQSLKQRGEALAKRTPVLT